MLRKATLCTLLTVAWQTLFAQSNAYLDVNDIRMRMFSNGSIGNPGAGAGVNDFEVPQGDGTSPLYSAGSWFSGNTSSNQTRAAASMYQSAPGRDFFPGPLRNDGSATADPTVSAQFDQVWVVSRAEINAHLTYYACVDDPGCDVAEEYPSGYVIPASILAWPATNPAPDHDPYVAPFFDRDGDGLYDPMVGDAPCILGDQAMFLVYNDMLEPHGVTGGQGVGLEVQVMPFAYTGASPALEQVVFLRYRVINRSTTTYTDAYFGTFNDFDIGCANDDFIGTDPSRNLFFGYNWSDIDVSCMGTLGYGPSPPAFGMTILKGPLVDANGTDTPADNLLPAWNGTGFGDGIADNERHGLSRSIYFNRQGAQHMTDPANITHFRGYMDARWKDGVPMTYGGSGYSTDPDAVRAYFTYPDTNDPWDAGTNGVPQPAWSELAPTPAYPDRRGLSSMGPFTFEPGEHLDMLFAYVYARSSEGALASVAALQARTDSVIAFANTLPIWYTDDATSWSGQCADYLQVGIGERTAVHTLTLFPSPTQDAFHFDAPAALVGAQLVVRDVTGREVLQQRVVAGMNRVGLQQATPGIYFCEVLTDKTRTVGRVVKE